MSTENPYTAPTAAIAEVSPRIPEDIRKKVKTAWVAGCISGTVTLAITAVAMSGTDMLGFDAWSLLDVALIFGLAFGIYKKSRACAVLMLLYFVASKILLMVEAGKPSGLLMALIFAYCFWQGVAGTFAYHRFKAGSSSLAASQA